MSTPRESFVQRWLRRRREDWWCEDCWEHLNEHQNVPHLLAFRATVACARNPGVRAARKEERRA